MTPAQQEIVWTIVVAGGSGARFGAAKQYAMIGDRRMLDISVDMAARCSTGVVVVVPAGDVEREARPDAIVVAGGASRSASVRSGLASVPVEATVILVHDAARPFATAETYGAIVEEVRSGADGAVPGLAVTDTIKVVDADRTITATPDRAALVAVQTPQGFRADVLRRAHASGGEGTDDAALVEGIGGRVTVVPGDAANRKITHPDDLVWANDRIDATGGRR